MMWNKDNKNKQEIYHLLDEALERVLQGEDINRVLADYPRFAGELKPLLQTALATRDAAALKPRPEFRRQASLDFQQAIRNMAAKPAVKQLEKTVKTLEKDAAKDIPRSYRRGLFGWGTAWSVGFAVLLAVLISGGGVVAASAWSLPDSPLYSIKLATESIQLAFTPSDVGKADLIAKFNDRRIDEVVAMAEEGNLAEISTLNSRLASNMVMINDLAYSDDTNAAGGEIKHVFGLDSYDMATTGETPAETALTTPAATTQAAAATRIPQTTTSTRTSDGSEITGTATPTPAPVVTPTVTVMIPPATTTTVVEPKVPPPADVVEESGSIFGNGDDSKEEKWDALKDRLSERQIENLRTLLEAYAEAPDWLKPSLEDSIRIVIEGYGLNADNSNLIYELLESYGLSMSDLYD